MLFIMLDILSYLPYQTIPKAKQCNNALSMEGTYEHTFDLTCRGPKDKVYSGNMGAIALIRAANGALF